MNANELVEATTQQLTKLADIIDGRAWGAGKGKPRIYMPSRRDCKIYFDFPGFPTGDAADVLGGSRLQIFIDDCGQHPNWYKGQKTAIVAAKLRPSLALCAIHAGDEQLAREIMETDEVLDAEIVEEASGHLINGRLAEAREAIFGATA